MDAMPIWQHLFVRKILLTLHGVGMVFPPPMRTADAAALATERERMLDRGVPPLAIGQTMAGSQSALLSSLKKLAPLGITAATQPNCQTVSCQNVLSF